MGIENNNINRQWQKMLVIFPVVVWLVMSAITSSVIAQSTNSKIVPSVSPLGSKPYGLTYGEWTAKWWQWTLSTPKDVNPGGDTTGKNCALKQSGPVWFLSGTFGGSATRVCTIP